MRRLDTRFGGGFGGQVLVELLGTDDAAGLQSPGAVGIGLGFRGHGFGFIQGSFGLVDASLDGFSGEHRQHLSCFHLIAHVHADFGEAQTANFSADAGFLPSGDRTVGAQALAEILTLH